MNIQKFIKEHMDVWTNATNNHIGNLKQKNTGTLDNEKLSKSCEKNVAKHGKKFSSAANFKLAHD